MMQSSVYYSILSMRTSLSNSEKKITFNFNSRRIRTSRRVGRHVKLRFKLNFSWNNDALHARCRAEVPTKLCRWHFRWLV